jgi:hypothetical protein
MIKEAAGMMVNTPVLYTVCYTPFDGSNRNDNLLAEVRRDFLQTHKAASGKVCSFAAGTEVRVRYKIGRGKFRWKKNCQEVVLQEAFQQKDGYYILTRNMAGETVSKACYDRNHSWLQTAYYLGDNTKPAALLQWKQDEGLTLLKFAPETGRYTQSKLEFCPVSPGTAEQSLINTVAGEPEILVQTDRGCFCCCSLSEKESRLAVLNDLLSGEKKLVPDWPQQEAAAFDFTYIENDGQKEREEKKKREAALLRETDYAANHELFSVDEPREQAVQEPEPPLPAPKRYCVASKGLNGATQISTLVPHCVQHGTKRIVISAEESYTYFGMVINGLRQGRGRTQMENGCTAYEGNYLNDKRDGFGAYYYKSGKICYVGDWKENKRDGVGVAYSSSDGSIFVGKWKDNIPTGSGAAFDADGSLIYTGEWRNGLRHGHGTEYKNGEVVFSGEFREDKYYSGYKHI